MLAHRHWLPPFLAFIAALAIGGCGGGSDDGGGGTGAVVEQPAGRAKSGVLFYANYGNEGETRVLANKAIVGALYQIYWSEVEPARGDFRWEQLDAHIARWRAAGKGVALRVMWSSSGYWPDPAAKMPTPQWVWDAGARHDFHAASGTEIALFWDPIYLAEAHAFLEAIGKRYDANPAVLFIDASPGAESNPYRLSTIDAQDPSYRESFLRSVASDGTTYSDALWWTTLGTYFRTVKQHFPTLPVLVTLNRATLVGASTRMIELGDLAVAAGLWVGQNGLKASSYVSSSSREPWLSWGDQTSVFFEMDSASGGAEGEIGSVVDACLRAGCNWLNVYAEDVVSATPGAANYQATSDAALQHAASALGPQ